MTNKHYCSILFLYISIITSAQNKIDVSVNSFGIVNSHKQIQPHYFYSNNWGIVSCLEDSRLIMDFGIKFHAVHHRNFELKVGVSGIIKNQWENSFLQEAFVSGKLYNTIDFSIGKEAYSPISYNDTLTSGGFLYNSNARPIPRFTIGIYEYNNVPLTKGYLQVKGGISHGMLNDDRFSQNKSNAAENVLLHEKWAYLRLNLNTIKPYAGLVHSSLFGGSRPSGEKLTIDYWATFIAGPSNKNGINETNALGAHEGFWDFGFYTSIPNIKFHFYYQKPFNDGSGLRIWKHRNKDFKCGTIISFDNSHLVKTINLECIKTDWQSGPGKADSQYPNGTDYLDHQAGDIIWMNEIENDLDDFMINVFGESKTGWTKSEVVQYLKDHLNNGYEFGGIDNYNNNAQYYNGWSYHGANFGYPLYHSYSLAHAYALEWLANNERYFTNTRIRALHLGIDGFLLPSLKYTIRATYSVNYGSYFEKQSADGSKKTLGDFYSDGKKQIYTALNLTHNFNNQIEFFTNVAHDFGELYLTIGGLIGVRYTPF